MLTRPHTHPILIIICLLAFLAMGLDTAVQKSPTADEPIHITRAIAIAQNQDLRLQQEHAPLSHWLISTLLRTEPLPPIHTLPGWDTADRLTVARTLLFERQLNLNRILWLSRLPIVLMGLLLGATTYAWANALGGRNAALIAAILFAFSPNLIANSALATTDFTTTVTFTLCLYTHSRYTHKPTHGRWLLASLTLGLALASKMTGILLLPLTGLLSYTILTHHHPQKPTDWLRPALRWLALLPPATLTIWSLYRFEIRPLHIPQLNTTLTLPAATFFQNFLHVDNHINTGHRAFFIGHIASDGWWSYFLITFLIKTSLPLLLLLMAALRHGRPKTTPHLWLPALLLLAIASYTRLNIGYRHILPILPLLIIWLSSALLRYPPRPLWQIGFLALLFWHIANGLAQHPHHLAHFNQLIGGPDNGHHYLSDSNLDWGQELKTAAHYLQTHPPHQTHLATFGFAPPTAYGLHGRPLILPSGFSNPNFAPANPTPGTYLISANFYQGLLAEPDLFNWFHRQPTTTKLGHALFVYDIPTRATGNWVAHCANPIRLLNNNQTTQLLGLDGTQRHLHFDCTQSWVIPNHGTPGWYILPLGFDVSWLTAQFPQDLQLIYTHRATVFAPSYAIYRWHGRTHLPTTLATQPTPIGNDLQFWGHQQQSQTWRTIWHIDQPTTQPLSVLAHLYKKGTPTPTAVADGLGYPPDQWQPGDTFIQYHPFTQTGDYLETGLYLYTTGQRLPIAHNPTQTTLRLQAIHE